MTIVAFVNQKGGCGKSTAAVHYAYWLTVERQQKTVLVDADAQRSSSYWVADMELRLPCVALQSPEKLLARLPELDRQADRVVVDGPASLARTTQSILLRADLAVVPVQPTGVDLRSAIAAMTLVRKIRDRRAGAPEAAVFLNRAVRGTRLEAEALEFLRDLPDLTLLETVVHQRQAIADTSGQGATVWELLGTAARDSAAEIEALCEEIFALECGIAKRDEEF